MNTDYLIYLAYHYFLLDEPFPVDVFIELNAKGFDPSELEEQFHDGYVPDGAELINLEDFEYDD